ncbi:Beta-lactamase [Fibrella aestuarina BUZ 2]|uniref:Beta-lactamase n=2 Tax=Fibrella TaxID=861914 RepID=I0KEZ6_9BACT|nr:subclass B1 metallo-beta-lactamase [Fibrella aestuarina]CCH02699.1 Beta-lactamase [Fibrella aestuarina BUZ 2]
MPHPMRFLFILLASTLFTHLAVAQAAQKPPLRVSRLSDRVFVHTTYGMYQGEPVPSNGLIVRTDDGVVLLDTGWDTEGNTDNTRQLLRWVADSLRLPVRLCIVTHSHDDKVGGIVELQKAGIRVVSTPLTAQKTVKQGYPSPDGILPADTTFTIGNVPIRTYFPGEGHTVDNIVVWLPSERILHGGCFVKSVAAFGMGYVGESNLTAWSGSIRNVKKRFGNARIVVPGHEEWTGPQALDHTLRLLEKYNANRH